MVLKSVIEVIDGADLEELKERRTFQDRYQKVLGMLTLMYRVGFLGLNV